VVRQDVLPLNHAKRPTVLLADDFVAFHDLIRELLEPEFEVVGAVDNGLALIDAAVRLTPDIIISDISMPTVDGFEALRQLMLIQLNVRFFFLTVDNDPALIEEARRSGASGYVNKSRAFSELVPAIRNVLNDGKFYLSKFDT
jgi:DNA-binding NarL/FixJ family response regulator